MPSTFSPRLRLELVGPGEQAGLWDKTTNRNLGTLLESAIAGSVTIALPDADFTLTTSNGGDDQARYAVLILTGTLTATRNVIVPSVTKLYVVRNDTNRAVGIKTATGVARVVPIGKTAYLFVDGTATTDSVNDFLSLNVEGATTLGNFSYTGTLTGGTGVVNIGSGQLVKTAGGNLLLGTTQEIAGVKLRVADAITSSLQLASLTTAMTPGTAIGRLEFYSMDNSNLGPGVKASVEAYSEEPNGAAASLRFFTSSGAAANTERARFSPSGNLLLNKTTDTGERLQVAGSALLGAAGTDVITVAGQVSSGGGVGVEGQVYSTRGPNLSPVWRDGLQSLAPQTATGTSVTFTGIPTTAKRVTITLNAVSSNGSSIYLVQLGTAGGFTVTGYQSVASAGNAASSFTTGFAVNINGAAAANNTSGTLSFNRVNGNSWVCSGVAGVDNAGTIVGSITWGAVSLAQAITQIRLTTVNGTDTFDAGSVVVFYE